MKNFFLHILYAPIGIILELAHLTKAGSDYLINKNRYKHAIIDRNAIIEKDCTLGEKVHILRDCYIKNSTIGNYTYISKKSFIQNTSIGNYCSISQEVICGLGNHPLNKFSTSPLFYHSRNTFDINIIEKENDTYRDYQPIKIGNDVWIGARAIILDGVTINDGACIAAGAVITKDVPPYAIVAGVPGKIIKYRVSTEKIDFLLKTKWWNLSPKNAYIKMKDYDL